MPRIDTVMERLEREGCRSTAPRRAVVREILARKEPFTSSELLDSIQERAPGIGRATVFRTLDLLSKVGIVQRIHNDASGGRCRAYLACEDTHHHHLICSECGTVKDFQEELVLDALVREIERRTDFHVEGHRLELTGLCPACRSEDKQASS